MAIRRKKPGQPARLSDSPPAIHHFSKAHRVCKTNGGNQVRKSVLPRQSTQDRINSPAMASSSKCSDSLTTTASARSSELLAGVATLHSGDENRSHNATMPQCDDGDDRTGKDVEGDGAQQEDSVCKLQNRLRDNWSKLVTDRITMMAFARSLKGHKCPAFPYCLG
ncbi:hypothetical protein HPB51_001528 [Rhipicephalus microplus]|uniref:Uncharacterized protein n=1 Tax=Rhipicephalus microplus TaxID=6941 RepID=A0A9J6EVP9_RHIMP|nr:uncharacterized protein LOC119180781 [Rhipicephalus microplus]KAH8038414.1 hypothetical protein HPB51_001528 [Rhipicephalus microplus]